MKHNWCRRPQRLSTEWRADYDADFTATALGRCCAIGLGALLNTAFAGRERLLEIGCGTGEDAVHLARRGHRVLATDASPQMVRVAQRQGRTRRCRASRPLPLHARWKSSARRWPARSSTASIRTSARSIARRASTSWLRTSRACSSPGAPLVWVVMGRYVPWEWAWYLARGARRKAFRRLRRDGVSWRGIQVSYPAPAHARARAAAAFRRAPRTRAGLRAAAELCRGLARAFATRAGGAHAVPNTRRNAGLR